MTPPNSYRTILRSSSIMGGASLAGILISLLRIKAVAILLGPTGVGLIGLFFSLVTTASTIAALGLGSVGTRQIAEASASDSADDVAAVRRALFLGTLVLSVAGGIGFFLLRHVLATQVLGDPLRATDVGWLSLGVVFTVAGGSQYAFLNGLRRIGDLARLQITSSLIATTFGVAALFVWHEGGLIAFVLATPLAGLLMGHWYVARAGRSSSKPTPLSVLVPQWNTMVRLGFPVMIGTLITAAGHLMVRSLTHGALGPESLGQFQAAWTISTTYLGVALGAMAADYFPRLTAAIHTPHLAVRLINEQTEIGLLLIGPALLTLMALAPFVVRLLYSSEFEMSADILRWQLLGDMLKVASWALGFVLLATGAGKTLIATESIGIGVFVIGTWIGLPLIGVEATGVSFVAMYVGYLPIVYSLARRRIGFRWTRIVVRQMLTLGFTAIAIATLARFSDQWAAGVGLLAAAGFGIYSLGRLGKMADLGGPVGRLAAISRRVMTKLGMDDV